MKNKLVRSVKRCGYCGKIIEKGVFCQSCCESHSRITIIDLYNMIANGEELPKTIMFRDYIYYLGKDNNYHDNYYGEYCDDGLFFFDDNNAKDFLNEQVEILKEEGDNYE